MHLYRVLFCLYDVLYAGYIERDGTFVNFENKKRQKAILYKEAFAARILHSGNKDSALNLTPL